MRHRKAGRKFNRNTSHRRAMFRNLAGNLLLHERIETTEAKAKELRRIVERLITKATRLGDDLGLDLKKASDDDRSRALSRRMHAQRIVASFVPKRLARTLSDGTIEEVDLVQKLFKDVAPRYMDRVRAGKGGGYTRIIKKAQRIGDGAPMVLLELLAAPPKAEPAKGEGKKKSGGRKKKAESAEAPASE